MPVYWPPYRIYAILRDCTSILISYQVSRYENSMQCVHCEKILRTRYSKSEKNDLLRIFWLG